MYIISTVTIKSSYDYINTFKDQKDFEDHFDIDDTFEDKFEMGSYDEAVKCAKAYSESFSRVQEDCVEVLICEVSLYEDGVYKNDPLFVFPNVEKIWKYTKGEED